MTTTRGVPKSSTMSSIRKTDTKPELIVRKFLFKNGFRYRLYVKSLPGNPDIVLRKHNSIIFINGCFWHAHEGCRLNRTPKTNQTYWVPKIKGNVERDLRNTQALMDLGWKVITIWECELRNNKKESALSSLKEEIANSKTVQEMSSMKSIISAR